MRSVFRHLGVWRHGPTSIVRFGEHRILDEPTVNMIADELNAVVDHEECRHLVLNFGGVVGLSSLMLGKLVMLQRRVALKDGRLKLCDVGPEIDEVFQSTKLHQILDIRESEADALKALAEPAISTTPTH